MRNWRSRRDRKNDPPRNILWTVCIPGGYGDRAPRRLSKRRAAECAYAEQSLPANFLVASRRHNGVRKHVRFSKMLPMEMNSGTGPHCRRRGFGRKQGDLGGISSAHGERRHQPIAVAALCSDRFSGLATETLCPSEMIVAERPTRTRAVELRSIRAIKRVPQERQVGRSDAGSCKLTV